MGRVDGSMRLVVVVLLGMIAVACSTIAASPSLRPPTPGSSPPVASASNAGELPAGSRFLDVGADVGDCVGPAAARLAVVEIPAGKAFHGLLPGALGTPELDAVEAPVTVVVYRDGWPGPLLGVPGVPRAEPKPGTWDACVRRTDGGDIGGLPFVVYGDIPSEGSPLERR